jgi:alcohol dehydrogenase
MMKAARMHEVGSPMVLEEVPVPEPVGSDVRIRVQSCGIVPNLANILENWTTWFPQNPLPALPAIFGLDPAGVIDAVGPDVRRFKPGDRVYVNPGRWCGMCFACRGGDVINCEDYAFSGYFGFTATSTDSLTRYPYGGLAQQMLAPASALVKLPGDLDFDHAARLGYLGTAYSGLKKLGVTTGSTVLINGISGTLGLGAALFALAMGASTILGTGRNHELLERVRQLAPERIQVHSSKDGPIDEWVKRVTGRGVDGGISALGPEAPHEPFIEGIMSVRRGGKHVNVGATAGQVPIDVHHLMDQQITLVGSLWFTPAEGDEMISAIESQQVDLSVLNNIKFSLDEVNDAINGVGSRNGGFSNFVVNPS